MIDKANIFFEQALSLFMKSIKVGGGLFFSTIFAQFISFLTYPIISRIYEVETFAVYSLFISVATVISCFATAKYSWAILLPDDERDVYVLVVLSLLIAGLCTLIVSFIVIILWLNGWWGLSRMGMISLVPFLFLFPFYPLVYATQEIHRSLMISRKEMAGLSLYVILSAILIIVCQVIFAFVYPQTNGLVFGSFLGGVLSIPCIFWQRQKYKTLSSHNFSRETLRSVARKYIEFPLITTPLMLSNYFFVLLTFSLVASNYGALILGVFSMAYKLIQLPFSLIEKSMSDILCRKISNIRNINSHSIPRIYILVVAGLLMVGFLAVVISYYFIPFVIPVLLGDKWLEVVDMIRILIFPLALAIIVVNMVMLFPMVHRKQYLFLPFKLTLDGVLPVLLLFFASDTIYDALHYFAIFSSSLSVLLIVAIYFWLLKIYRI